MSYNHRAFFTYWIGIWWQFYVLWWEIWVLNGKRDSSFQNQRWPFQGTPATAALFPLLIHGRVSGRACRALSFPTENEIRETARLILALERREKGSKCKAKNIQQIYSMTSTSVLPSKQLCNEVCPRSCFVYFPSKRSAINSLIVSRCNCKINSELWNNIITVVVRTIFMRHVWKQPFAYL